MKELGNNCKGSTKDPWRNYREPLTPVVVGGGHTIGGGARRTHSAQPSIRRARGLKVRISHYGLGQVLQVGATSKNNHGYLPESREPVRVRSRNRSPALLSWRSPRLVSLGGLLCILKPVSQGT